MFQSQQVAKLEKDPKYQAMAKKTVKQRIKAKQTKKFREMRGAIRRESLAARQAYALATAAIPDTPHAVKTMLDADTWEAIVELCQLLEDKGWFKAPPKNSMLRREPACAWLVAGATAVSLRSTQLPALHKHVLRQAVQRWQARHFYLPVAGTDKAGIHHNYMKMFVTYVWAYYTCNQNPIVPALTDVGRFLFTYIWRRQHNLFR